jgi:dihydrofolate reductase
MIEDQSYKPNVKIIFARASNGVIGKENTLPWYIPEDMKRFKELTAGSTVIMGRKTYDSLPAKFKPLPGRTNVVITRQKDWNQQGVVVAYSAEEALTLCPKDKDIWVIGGSEIYCMFMEYAQQIEITEIEKEFDGDAFSPKLDSDWEMTDKTETKESNGLFYHFTTYTRTKE